MRTGYGVVRVYRFAGIEQSAQTHDADDPSAVSSTAPFVLLPGRSSGTPVWASNLPSLREIGDVYAIDLLGEPGMSVQERPITSDADQAAWLGQTLEALPDKRFHLVGLSIGGWSAINLARHSTDHLAGITLLDAPFVFDDLPVGTIIRTIPIAFPWVPRAWRDSFSSYTAGGAEVEDLPVAHMIEAGMQHYRLRLPAPSQIDEADLTSLSIPVLAVIAGRSVMHDPPTAQATAENALGAEPVRVYPDASHAINGEYPTELATDIARFARSLE